MTLSPRLKVIIAGVLLFVLAAGAVVSLMIEPDAPPGPKGLSGKVDHYLLSLSWSPSYCIEAGNDADPRQCGGANPFAFTILGLWPQGDDGPLRDCDAAAKRVSDSIVEDMRMVMPSARLMGNQWRKHGTCTGLSQEDYFDVTRRAYKRINIPAEYAQLAELKIVAPREVEDAFVKANRGLAPDMVAVTCTDRHIREVRICLSTDLEFRTCKAARNDCPKAQISMPPVETSEAAEATPPPPSPVDPISAPAEDPPVAPN
jgi:ribonuclease T2